MSHISLPQATCRGNISLPLAMVPTNQSHCFTSHNYQLSQYTLYIVHTVVQYQTLLTQTKEEDALIDTNQEAISYRSIYSHVAFLTEAQCSQLQPSCQGFMAMQTDLGLRPQTQSVGSKFSLVWPSAYGGRNLVLQARPSHSTAFILVLSG